MNKYFFYEIFRLNVLKDSTLNNREKNILLMILIK